MQLLTGDLGKCAKKILSCVLAAVLVVCALPADIISTATEIKSDGYTYGVSKETWEEKLDLLPRTVYLGDWGDSGHMQGFAVDDELKYIYASFTTVLAKIEIATGEVVGTVVDVPGHIGDLAYYDGRIYSAVALNGYKVFYAAAFDCDKIEGEVTFADCGTAMHLAEATKDYIEDFDGQYTISNSHASTGHAYGANGVDGIAFGTIPGDKSGEIVMMVTVGAYNGGSEEYPNQDRNYQKILQYSLDSFLEDDGNGGTKFKEDVSQNNMGSSYTKGPAHEDKYFLLTGGSPYGSQNFDYDEATGNYIMATYGITGDGFPSYNKFVVDGNYAPQVETLDLGDRQELYASMPNTNPGCENMAQGKVAKHAEIGTYHEATGIWGNKNGGNLQTGVDHLFGDYFYISEIFNDETTGGDSANAHLYEWDRETDTFTRVLTQAEELALLIGKAEAISLGYTEESLAALNSALASAKTVSEDTEATTSAIAEATNALENAIDNLQIKTNSEQSVYSDSIDSIPDSTNILYTSANNYTEAKGKLGFVLRSKTNGMTTSRMGTVNSSNTITKTTAVLGSKDTLQSKYDDGEDLILGSTLTDGGTYSSDDNATGNKIAGQPFKGAYVKKVTDPAGGTNNVLEFNYGQTGSVKADTVWKGFHVRLYNNTSVSLTTVTDEGHTANGKLVYEWKVRVPKSSVKLFTTKKGSNCYWISLGGIESNASQRLLWDCAYYDGSNLAVGVDGYNVDTGVDGMHSYVISPDEWHTFRQVVSASNDTLTSGYPLVDYYVDGNFIGTFKAEKQLLGDATSGWKSGAWMAELGPTATGDSTIDANNMVVYYDDIKQYWLSDLTVSGLKESYTDFSVNNTVEVTYSSPVNIEALANAITVTKDGEQADVTPMVTLKDEYTALISFEGIDTTAKTTYNVTISEFEDIFGIKNKTSKAFTVTTKEAGKMAVTPSVSSIYRYEAKTHSLFTITTECKADLSNVKFYVKDSEGNIVKELTPTADETGTILTFDLYNAGLGEESASYTFVSDGYFVQDGGDLVNTDIITIPITVVSYDFDGTYLINDDYEDVTADENWLINTSAKPSNYAIDAKHDTYTRGTYSANTDGTYSFKDCARCEGTTFAENFLTDYFIGVTYDPKDSTNKVLKYQSGKNGDGTHGFRVASKLSDTTVDTSKNIVMSADILLTDTLKGKISSSRYNNLPIISTRQNFENNFIRPSITSTDTSIKISGQGGMTTELAVGEWFETKYVILPTATITTSDDGLTVTYDRWTYMVYINGVLVEVNETSVFNGYNGSMQEDGVTYKGALTTTDNTGLSIYGVHMGLYPSANEDYQPTFYVDNIKLYQPSKPVATTTVEANVVTVSYNNVIAKDSADNVVISDMYGNAVTGAATDVVMGVDGKSLVITLDTSVVTGSTEYTVSAVTDAFGQKSGVTTFTTPKSYTVYIDNELVADTSVQGSVSVPVKVVNATGKNVPAVLMVAVYNNNFEMIGFKGVEFSALTSAGYEDTITVDIADNEASDIKKIKVYIWDSVAKMQPYQNAEIVSLQ